MIKFVAAIFGSAVSDGCLISAAIKLCASSINKTCLTSFPSAFCGFTFKTSRISVHNIKVKKLEGPVPNDSISIITGYFSISSGEKDDIGTSKTFPKSRRSNEPIRISSADFIFPRTSPS